jgi:hypothetical protein
MNNDSGANMNKDSGVTSKLNALLRLGLVSKNNVRRAIYVFQNPEQAMKQAQNRTLMQELLIDVVDRIINNKSLYAMVRQNLTKDAHTAEAAVTEDVSDERTKTLLRSGLVKKKDVVVARRALSSKSNMKQMVAVGAYRELMIDMLDSMAKKITGNPALFNAFKRTMGDSQADESFTSPNMETILEFGLDQDAAELLESHKPSDSKLWTMAKKQARGMFESNAACQNAWAMKWYNEQDGAWTPISEGKTFTKFMRSLEEGESSVVAEGSGGIYDDDDMSDSKPVKGKGNKVLSPKQKKLDVNKNKRLDAEDFKALRLRKEEVDTAKPATQTPEQAEQARRANVVARAKKLAKAAMRAAAQTNKPVKEGTEAKMGRVMDAETKAHEQGNLPKRERLTKIKKKLDDGLVKKWQRRGGSMNPGVFLNAAAKKRKAALALKNKGKA